MTKVVTKTLQQCNGIPTTCFDFFPTYPQDIIRSPSVSGGKIAVASPTLGRTPRASGLNKVVFGGLASRLHSPRLAEVQLEEDSIPLPVSIEVSTSSDLGFAG